MKVQLFGKNVLVKVELKKETEETRMGITVPGKSNNEPSIFAEVIEVGSDCEKLKIGDRVIIGNLMGNKFDFNGEEVELFNEDQIIGKVLS